MALILGASPRWQRVRLKAAPCGLEALPNAHAPAAPLNSRPARRDYRSAALRRPIWRPIR